MQHHFVSIRLARVHYCFTRFKHRYNKHFPILLEGAFFYKTSTLTSRWLKQLIANIFFYYLGCFRGSLLHSDPCFHFLNVSGHIVCSRCMCTRNNMGNATQQNFFEVSLFHLRVVQKRRPSEFLISI